LAELNVSQRRNFREALANLFRKLAAGGQVGAADGNLNGVGEPKLITRLTMSLGSKENFTSGISWEKRSRKRSFNGSMFSFASGLNCTWREASSGPLFHK